MHNSMGPEFVWLAVLYVVGYFSYPVLCFAWFECTALMLVMSCFEKFTLRRCFMATTSGMSDHQGITNTHTSCKFVY